MLVGTGRFELPTPRTPSGGVLAHGNELKRRIGNKHAGLKAVFLRAYPARHSIAFGATPGNQQCNASVCVSAAPVYIRPNFDVNLFDEDVTGPNEGR